MVVVRLVVEVELVLVVLVVLVVVVVVVVVVVLVDVVVVEVLLVDVDELLVVVVVLVVFCESKDGFHGCLVFSFRCVLPWMNMTTMAVNTTPVISIPRDNPIRQGLHRAPPVLVGMFFAVFASST